MTRTYAEAAAEVAADTGAELLDLWGIFMEHAGWTEGEPLLGEIGVPKSEKLGELLSDGRSIPNQKTPNIIINRFAPFKGSEDSRACMLHCHEEWSICRYRSSQIARCGWSADHDLDIGLHFTHLGYKLYFDSLKALLEKKLPEIYDCPRGFPNWGEAPRCQ